MIYRYLISLVISLCIFVNLDAQSASKPVIDSAAINKWPSLDNRIAISNDGNYFLYSITNQPVGSTTLIVQSTHSSWKKEFIGVSEGFFSGDSRQFIFRNTSSLVFLKLGTNDQVNIPNISSYRKPNNGKGEWLAYQMKNSTALVLQNLFTGKEQSFEDVKDFFFDEKGNALVIKKATKHDDTLVTTLWWLDLARGYNRIIWFDKSSTANNLSFDNDGKQLVFVVEQNSLNPLPKMGGADVTNQATKSIWYYKTGMEKAVVKVDNRTPGIDPKFSINGSLQFSKNGHWIFFNLQPIEISKPNPDAVKVNIWSYKEQVLQPEQIRQLGIGPNKITAVVNAEDSHVICLEQEGEELKTFPNQITGDFLVIGGKYIDPWWKFDPPPSLYLLSLKDGSRRLLQKEDFNLLYMFSFSPDGKYLLYYNIKQEAYFCYDVITGKARNITQSIIPGKFINEYQSGITQYAVSPVAGWLEEENGVLIYDNYDIWLAYLSDDKPPVNITNGYGKKYHIKLRLVYGTEGNISKDIFKLKESLLITAFSPINKYNGFYRKVLGEKGDPELLTMAPYMIYRTRSQIPDYSNEFDNGMQPVKVADDAGWIVKRQTASIAPNYFFTNDFIIYKQLSNLQPQKKYNWLSSELVLEFPQKF